MKKNYLKSVLLCTILLCAVNIFAQSGGDNLFNETTHNIYINFTQPNYWSLLQANKSTDDANNTNTYIPAQIIVDGVALEQVGIQFKGNSSYYNYPGTKKPFTLAFDQYVQGQDLDGLKSLNLNNMYQDPSFMREKMFLDFANEKGLNAPRANYAKLYINNQYWGLYLMCERIKKKFTQGRFGNSDGNLFKGDGTGASCANLEYHGVMSPYYNCYELTNNATANDWSDLIDLTAQINTTADTQFNSAVNAVLNTNSFIGAWAAYNLFCDFDSYPYRFSHNYYLYHNTATDKFEWIIWDVSTAFGLDIPGTISSIENQSVLYITPDVNERPLTKRMFENPAFRDAYLQTICSYANNDFLPGVLNPRIDELYSRIQNDVYTDNLKMYSSANFDDNINTNTTISGYTVIGLKSFIANRSTAVLNELNTLGYTSCQTLGLNNNIHSNSVTISPNPASSEIMIQSAENLKGYQLSLFDLQGRLCQLQFLQSEKSNQIILNPNLANGLYFIQLKKGQRIQNYKIIKDQN